MRAVIISCAVTGGADNADKNPAIPVTPAQIASEVLAARAAGAAVAHIHVRDPGPCTARWGRASGTRAATC